MDKKTGFISEHKAIFQQSFQNKNPLPAGFVCELRSCVRQVSHHLHHFHLSIDAQVIEEGDEIFLHLDTIVIHLSYSENAHLALPPHLRDKTGTFTDNEQNVLSVLLNPPHFVLCNLCSLFTKVFIRQNHIKPSQM